MLSTWGLTQALFLSSSNLDNGARYRSRVLCWKMFDIHLTHFEFSPRFLSVMVSFLFSLFAAGLKENAIPVKISTFSSWQVAWCVSCYMRGEKDLDSLLYSLSLSPFLTVWTARSCPLLNGCYGAEVMCFVLFFRVNVLNSSLVNEEPLSVTIICRVAKTNLRVSVVFSEAIFDMCNKPLRTRINNHEVHVSIQGLTK